MSDFKESLNDLLLVLLSIAVLMLLVYFQQSQQWNRTLKSSDQRISNLDQKIAEHVKALAQVRGTIAGHEASAKNADEEIKSARQIIGELESRKQKNEKEIAALKSALQQKDTEAAELNARLSEIKVNAENRLSAKEGEIKHLANGAAEQTRLLSEARDMIQRLEESEKALQEKLQAADQAYAQLNESHQRLSEELAALKKED